MNKKVLLLIAGATVFTLGIGTIAFSGLNQVENLRTNATETRAISFDKRIEGRYSAFDEDNHTMTIEGQLQDGNSVFMRAYNVTTVSTDGYYANIDTSIIFYSDQDCTNEYTFQDLRSFTFTHEANDSDIIFDATLYDGFNYSYLNNQRFNKNNATVSSFDVDYIRRLSVHFTSSNAIDIHSLTLTYVCSYDYVEPALKTIEIYSTNDFHGAVLQDSDNPGLAVWGSYLKLKGAESNTLLLDQGDTWQGSIYSNLNHGNLINDVMCVAGFDGRTVGNHDFDWGDTYLKQNSARSFQGYKIPALAANIYDYNFTTKEFGTTQQEDYGSEYVIHMVNGLKVGVIGVIGSDQIKEINSLYTREIGFKPHVEIIKNLATKLKTVEGCDLVICSIHGDEDDVKGNNLKASGVDLVLCAHSHQSEVSHEDDLYFGQFYKEGRQIGHITLTYNTYTKKVTTNIEKIYKNNMIDTVNDNGGVDPTIANLIATSNASIDEQANLPVASDVVNFPRGNGSVNYLYNAADGKYFESVEGQWIKRGRVANPVEDSIYIWENQEQKDEAVMFEGAYYVDQTTGKYFKYSGGSLDELGSFMGGNNPEDTDCYFGYYGTGFFDDYEELPNLMAKAILRQANDIENKDVAFAYVNNGRADINQGEWTYSDIFRTFPFDNEVYVINVAGIDIINELKYNFVCWNPEFNRSIDVEARYKVACIDYLAFHTNAERSYDYFPSITGAEPTALTKNYRDIVKDYLIAEGYDSGKALNKQDYRSSIDEFDRTAYTISTMHTATFMYNYDGAPNEGVYTTVEIVHGGVVANYLPVAPSRDGYIFSGWFRDAACTLPLGGWYLNYDTNFYAKWVDGYSTGQVTYTEFLADDGDFTTTTVDATAGSGAKISVTFNHSAVTKNGDYPEFGFANYGHITMTAPTGYIVLSIEVKTYGTYDNLEFHSGTSDSGDMLTKNKVSANYSIVYNVDVGAESFYIKSTYSGNVWFYYVSVILVAAS